MSANDKLREYETTRREFDEYADAFAADVERRRQEYADGFATDVARRARDFDRAGDAFAAYAAEFAADVEAKRDVTDLLAGFEASREEAAAWQAQFEAAVRAFLEAVEANAAEMDALRDEFRAISDEFAAYRAEFAAAVQETADNSEIRAAFEAKSETFDRAAEEFARSVAEFRGDVDPETVERAIRAGGSGSSSGAGRNRVAAPPTTGSATRDPASGSSVETAPSSPSVDDRSNDDDSDPDPVSEGSTDESTTGESESIDDADAEAVEETLENQDAGEPTNGDRRDLIAELRQIQYAKLKQVANTIGYDGNLNNATKDELVTFLADNADEVEAALVGGD